MKQFDIAWAETPEPVGRRPVLLLTRSEGYAYLNKIVIAEVTTVTRNIPSCVGLLQFRVLMETRQPFTVDSPPGTCNSYGHHAVCAD